MAALSDSARRRHFEDVVAAAYGPVQRYLLRRTDVDTAEDVLGDVLLVLWRRADDIPEEAPLPWCYAVARRCLANSRRAAQRRNRLLTRLTDEVPVPTATGSPDLDLTEALTALSDTDRELLRLWAWEQLAPREIARVLDISPNAVSIRLHRATRRLKAQLAQGKNSPGTGQLPKHQGTEASR